jgi:hypothetical protein
MTYKKHIKVHNVVWMTDSSFLLFENLKSQQTDSTGLESFKNHSHSVPDGEHNNSNCGRSRASACALPSDVVVSDMYGVAWCQSKGGCARRQKNYVVFRIRTEDETVCYGTNARTYTAFVCFWLFNATFGSLVPCRRFTACKRTLQSVSEMLCRQKNFLTCFSPVIFSCFATRWLWLLNQADSKRCCGSGLATCSSFALT